jgi:2-phospho-L-lactate guanylyltransferase
MSQAPDNATVALIPVKAFALAKGRLAPVLTAAERAGLAEAMLRDVIAAATACPAVREIALLGGSDARRTAAGTGVQWLDDGGEAGLNTALNRAAVALAERGVATLLVLPDDLPVLHSDDIVALLACHRRGLTLSPARSDGGTNGLAMSPPDAMEFLFGVDSARQHLAEARARQLPAQEMTLSGFARDIDGPADLRWLCEQQCGEHTAAWLAHHDIAARLRATGQAVEEA